MFRASIFGFRIFLYTMVGGGLAYIYWPTLSWLGREWLGDGPFSRSARDWSHGPLVLLLLGFVAWRRWGKGGSAGDGRLWGLPVALLGPLLHLASLPLQAPYLSAYSLVPLAAGLVFLSRGPATGLRLLPVLHLFVLAVPFPALEWGLVPFLQQVVASGSTFLAGLAGALVERWGQTIVVGDHIYEVAPLCSGFNVVMALLSLAMPLLLLRKATARSLAAALLWVPALGLAAKVTLIALVLYLTPGLGPEKALALYHGWLGIAFYLASLAVAVGAVRSGRLSSLNSLSSP